MADTDGLRTLPSGTEENLVSFADIDVYSLVDADSDEARTFTTYLGYWVCLAAHLQNRYGDDCCPALLYELNNNQSAFRRIAGRGKPADPDSVRGLLLNGWTSELRLNLIELDDDEGLTLANHGAPIDAYYATSRHATAWLCVRDGGAPNTHRGLLNAVSAQVTGSRLYPPPWDMLCTGLYPQSYSGFPSPPGPCSNLASAANHHDRAAMMLRTTRQRGVENKVAEVKQKRKLNRAPAGEKKRQDSSLPATTVFDFAWRMRARSNYGDPAMFYVGSLDHTRARAYGDAVRTWTSATMFLFEAFIAQRAKDLVADAAAHFMSRDRSGLADVLIIPRLRTLGLVPKQTSVHRIRRTNVQPSNATLSNR
jgi:hypothetical protein